MGWHFPVEPLHIAAELGALIKPENLDMADIRIISPTSAIEAITFYYSNQVSEEQKRFSAACAIWFWLSGYIRSNYTYTFKSTGHFIDTNITTCEEILLEARLFALQVLMPQTFLRVKASTDKLTLEKDTAQFFGVDIEVAQKRLDTLSYISLFEQF